MEERERDGRVGEERGSEEERERDGRVGEERGIEDQGYKEVSQHTSV